MKLKLIAMSILLLLIFVGYPKYKMMQQEDEIRAFLKGPFIEEVKKEAQPKAQQMNLFELDMLNQYPDFHFYQKYPVEAAKLPKLSANIDQLMKDAMCAQIAGFSTMNNSKELKAFVRVLQQDKITFHIIILDKYSTELAHFKQQVADCPVLQSAGEGKPNAQIPVITVPEKAEPMEVAPAATSPVEQAATL